MIDITLSVGWKTQVISTHATQKTIQCRYANCFPMFSNVFNTKLGHRLCPNVFKTNNLYFPPQLLLQAEKLVNDNTSYLKYFWWCNVSINFHIFCNWGFFCDTNNTKSEYTSFWRSYGPNCSLIYIFWLTVSLYPVNFFLTSETRKKVSRTPLIMSHCNGNSDGFNTCPTVK